MTTPFMRMFFLYLITLGIVSTSSGKELTASQAEEIYNLAQLRESTLTFLTYETHRESKRGPADVRHYYKVSKEGFTLYRSDEVAIHQNTGKKLSTSIYHNIEGKWSVVNNVAVHVPNMIDPLAEQPAELSDEDEEDKKLKQAFVELSASADAKDVFSGSTVIRDGVDFAVVEIKYSKQKVEIYKLLGSKSVDSRAPILASMQLNQKEVERELANYKRMAAKLTPARKMVVIDVRLPLIVEERTYNADGAVVKERIRKNVSISPQDAPNDDFFALPLNIKRYFPAHVVNYQALLKIAWRQQLEQQGNKNKKTK